MDVALALVVVAGALGVVNGWLMAQTGRRNRLLIYALIGVFAAAVFVAASATR
jgi:MFS family permease